MAEIEWGLLPHPDFMGTYINALQAGQAAGKAQARDRVLANYPNDPEGTVNALMGIDPQSAIQLAAARRQQQLADQQSTVYQQGQADRAANQKLGGILAAPNVDEGAAMSAAAPLGADAVQALREKFQAFHQTQRDQLQHGNRTMAIYLHNIQGTTKDLGERMRMAQHLAGLHPEWGIDPASIDGSQVTDEAIQQHLAQSSAIEQALAPPQKPIVVGMGDTAYVPDDTEDSGYQTLHGQTMMGEGHDLITYDDEGNPHVTLSKAKTYKPKAAAAGTVFGTTSYANPAGR